MTIWAVIPAKPAEEGKSRLAGILSGAERFRLNRHLFRRTLATALTVFAPERIIVVSRDSALLGIAAAAGAQALTEHGHELNAALHQAAALPPQGDGLLSISTDLPNLTPDDLLAMLEQPSQITIAPDHAGSGTNALLTCPAACIPYCFGENSFTLHNAHAARLGITPRLISRPGLAFDIDTPEDFCACPAALFNR